jgi:hypothetical protein
MEHIPGSKVKKVMPQWQLARLEQRSQSLPVARHSVGSWHLHLLQEYLRLEIEDNRG